MSPNEDHLIDPVWQRRACPICGSRNIASQPNSTAKKAAEKMPDTLTSAVSWKAAEVCLRNLREKVAADDAMRKCYESLGIKIGLKGEEK